MDCRKFIEKDCLGVMLAALSSHDPSMRSAAYHIIERFYFHLEGARFLEVEQIQYILELLKNSVAASRSKLPCIVTVFLARAVRIMLKAGTVKFLFFEPRDCLAILGRGPRVFQIGKSCKVNP